MQTRNSVLRDYWRGGTGSRGRSGNVVSLQVNRDESDSSSQGFSGVKGLCGSAGFPGRGKEDNRGMKRALIVSMALHILFLALVPTFPRPEEKPETFIEVEMIQSAEEKIDDGIFAPTKMNKASDTRVKRSSPTKRSKSPTRSKRSSSRKSSSKMPAAVKPAQPVKPAETVKPADPVMSVEPAKPAEAVKPAASDKPLTPEKAKTETVEAKSDSGLKVPERRTVSVNVDPMNMPSDVKVKLRDNDIIAAMPNSEVKTGIFPDAFAQARRIPKPKKPAVEPFKTSAKRGMPVIDDLVERSMTPSQRTLDLNDPAMPNARRSALAFREDGHALDNGEGEDARNVDALGPRALGQVEDEAAGVGDSSSVQADIEMSIMDKGKGKYSDPRLLVYTAPRYPVWAEKRGLFGKVTLKIMVDDLGSVTDSVIIGSSVGDRGLVETARRSSLKWKFARVLLDGKAVPAAIRIVVHFKLN